MKNKSLSIYKITFLIFTFLIATNDDLSAQIIDVGSGSYTTTFPGKDEAGRNDFPSGAPQLSGNAAGKPVPTNDWWSKLIKENHADNLFNYPFSMKTTNQGLIVSNVEPVSTPNGSSQPFGDGQPIVLGIEGMNASRVTVSDHSDWTVTMNSNQGGQDMSVTSGIGMPFLYLSKNSMQDAVVTVNEGEVTMDEEVLIITNSFGGFDYAVYAPVGSTWEKNGSTYSTDLNGKNYWSMAMLPEDGTSAALKAEDFKKFAYVFPVNTITSWNFEEATSILTTLFEVETEIKEGDGTTTIIGLLPHQWSNLSAESAQPGDLSYTTIRGELKILEANAFEVEHIFRGILPTLPYVSYYSDSFDPSALNAKIGLIENDGLPTWTDSYNEGQLMNRLIQTARIADEIGDFAARDKLIITVKERLEDWLKAETGEIAFLYYYNATWSTLIGYPAGHGQDNNINDHHFHWGYFIHAAAFVEQYNPGWSEEWGGMIDLLIRDAASSNRNDADFPFLRNFSPFAGHSWANGFASFPFGNDQESTSESMQFASSLIHWGSVVEDDAIRDLGIYIYTTEQSATEEYWFDINKRTFKPGYGYQLASRIWGNGYDNQTFWTSDIAAAYGIEMYPIHGGSLYLGHDQEYAQSLWNEITTNTGILSNEENPNLWHDTYWKYLSMIDPESAIELYNSYPDRNLKFGISDAQTYHWLHAMNVLGKIDTDITSDHPIAVAFTRDGETIYVAHNYSDVPIVVRFSDGFELDVPANELVTSLDIALEATLSSNFMYAYPGGSVILNASVSQGQATKVEFFDGNVRLGEDETAPFEFKAENLSLGIHGFYAKVYQNENFVNTNIVSVQVGEQSAFQNVFQIPGVIEAANYDTYEGGVGQNITYLDLTQDNFGDYRLDEFVDSELNAQEGPTLVWIDAGEWLEYSIYVETTGYYDVSFRFSSDISSGGGPFHFEIDGNRISPDAFMEDTNGWDTWKEKTLEDIELTQGNHILRLVVTDGGFNLGRMNFTYSSTLDYVPPIADAGENVSVVLPNTAASLDGSMSFDPEGEALTFQWQQIYGPSVIVFDDSESDQPMVTNLEEGVYKCKLSVSDGTYDAHDDVLIIVSSEGNLTPSISITSPTNDENFKEGEVIEIMVSTSDIDGTVEKVEFYANDVKIGEDISMPFSYSWEDADVGQHILRAVAIDDQGGEGTSQEVNIEVAEVLSCSEMSSEAQQGAFSTGYEATFETVGSNVTITFTLLDTDKVGVVAFLWQEWPFTEYQMDHVEGLTFTKTFGGQTVGTELSFACKFAFAGGLAVTKYINYTVGEDCSILSDFDLSADKIKVYPNPTSDFLHVQGLEETMPVSIYNSSGQLIKAASVLNQLDVSDLQSGVYFISIGKGRSTIVKEFVKE